MSQLTEEISRRRTFAIISHPDAGKTTLTEKFLLYGGAIAQAGVVKGKKNSRAATSDWMEIEKQRGISVTSSVMQFQYDGFCINILDTPGHQDFSEDTYRTLMAADSAVMVIDGAKGVEPQTRKLFKVCAMRHIPIFTFINKMDREARDPFELLRASWSRSWASRPTPSTGPSAPARSFRACTTGRRPSCCSSPASPARTRGGQAGNRSVRPAGCPADGQRGKAPAAHRRRRASVGAGREMDMQAVRDGQLSPVFFGSALTNFGVEPFLEAFLKHDAASPRPHRRLRRDRPLQPGFLRLRLQDSGEHEQGAPGPSWPSCASALASSSGTRNIYHVQGNKKMRLSQPQQLMAAEREIVDEAYAGRHHRRV